MKWITYHGGDGALDQQDHDLERWQEPETFVWNGGDGVLDQWDWDSKVWQEPERYKNVFLLWWPQHIVPARPWLREMTRARNLPTGLSGIAVMVHSQQGIST